MRPHSLSIGPQNNVGKYFVDTLHQRVVKKEIVVKNGGCSFMGSVVKKRRKKIRKHKYRKLKKQMRHKNK